MPIRPIHDRIEARPDEARAEGPAAQCFWCEQLHIAEHPLSVCPTCAARFATLRSLEMNGSYPLDDAAIDRALTRTSAGNYALGYMDGESFTVFYVGRSDADLRECLHDWVDMPSRYDRWAPSGMAAWSMRPTACMPAGTPSLGRVGAAADSSYTRFAFSYAASAEAAFEKECRNYDAFGGNHGLDNESPPVWMP